MREENYYPKYCIYEGLSRLELYTHMRIYTHIYKALYQVNFVSVSHFISFFSPIEPFKKESSS